MYIGNTPVTASMLPVDIYILDHELNKVIRAAGKPALAGRRTHEHYLTWEIMAGTKVVLHQEPINVFGVENKKKYAKFLEWFSKLSDAARVIRELNGGGSYTGPSQDQLAAAIKAAYLNGATPFEALADYAEYGVYLPAPQFCSPGVFNDSVQEISYE
jgi:hypothetical protein